MEFVSTITDIQKSSKYKINYINVKFKNNERIEVNYPNSFFSVEEYLSINIGDSLTYHLLNDKVSKVKNLKNNNELDELYFVIQETNGFQIFIIFFLMTLNAFQMVKLDAFSGVFNSGETQLKLKKNIYMLNDFTKKHKLITLLLLSIFIFFAYQILRYVKQNQVIFDDIYFYKYLILLYGLLIPLPFIFINYRLLKKVEP